ncbi:hypothetical protein Hanom_Chr03g00278701 [Helianthus anomalus]
MNRTQISILKQTNKVRFSSLLKSSHSRALEPQICLKILSNFSHKPLERKLPDQKLSALLVLPDLSQRDGSRPEPVRLLHSSGGRCRLPCCFSCQLLSRSLSSGGFPCGLFGFI